MKDVMKQKAKVIADAREVVGHLNPAEIIDQESYNHYIELSKNPYFHDKMHINTSKGKRLSLGTLTHNLKQQIEDLPEQEQKTILAKRKVYNSLLCKRNAALRKAYGTIVDAAGQPSIKSTLFDQRKTEMVELFGRMFTAQEVHEVAVKDWLLPVTLKGVMEFRTVHWQAIERKIEEHKRTYSDIRLGYKRSRLEELSWLYIQRKRVYEGTKNREDHRLLLMTLEQIRKEVEGDSIRIDGALNIDIETTIGEHIHKELFKNLPLKEIILSRVAAKIGSTPEFFVTQLNKAYYGRFLQVEDIEHEELPAYPSNEVYDMESIKRRHLQESHNQQIAAQLPSVKVTNELPSGEAQTSADDFKTMLLAKLTNTKEKVNFVKNSLQGRFIDNANKMTQ